jgi:hypothetical protein
MTSFRQPDRLTAGPLPKQRAGYLYGGVTIPGEHGIDGLGERGAGCLVDAACVDPDPAIAIGDYYVSTLFKNHNRRYLLSERNTNETDKQFTI